MRKVFIDCETCGLYGMPITLQYAFDDEPEIHIWEFWRNEAGDSLKLIEEIAKCEVIGFNLVFDWFHLCKIYTTLKQAPKDFWPEDDIDQMAIWEERGRNGPCLKPANALDLMLHARKGEFQMTMGRSDIRIRRIPTQLAQELAKKLDESIELESILFSAKKVKNGPRWQVQDIKQADGEIRPDFKDVVLRFRASSSLKALAVHALNIPASEVVKFQDIEVDKAYRPKELGYAPFALATGRPGLWNKAWPQVIRQHINHWGFNDRARKYAGADVDYTRRLYHYFNQPPAGDDDSVLSCMAAAVRWRGYSIDEPGIRELKRMAEEKIHAVPTSPREAKKYIKAAMSETEAATFHSTGKVILAKIAAPQTCIFGPCELCNQTGKMDQHEAGRRAGEVLEARRMLKEVELYNKLLRAGRFHFSVKIIGALSTRMAGADGLNGQGIKKTTDVRSKFPLAFGGLKLKGGDFAGFEVVLAVAAYGDEGLERDLKTCEKCRDTQVIYTGSKKKCPKCGGKATMKIHALFGESVYPGMSYDDIKATDGAEDDKYTKSKSAVFALIYGGEAFTLMTRLGVPLEVAEAAVARFIKRYPGVGKARQRIINGFCSMKQLGGIGSRIEYSEPKEYVESLLGFRRYFTLENRIVKALYELAQDPPEEWKNIKIKVRRRADKEQTAAGALQSALYGAAFQVQAANMRAAANHEIQSSGAGITKYCERKLWDIQPSGVHEWLVQPANVHDEILSPTHDSVVELARTTIDMAVEDFRERVPLIEFEWKEKETWAKN